MFEPLPVRRGEFRRNIKKQYNRLLRGMQAYALISLGVRITVTNTKAKGGRQTLIGTQVGTWAARASFHPITLQERRVASVLSIVCFDVLLTLQPLSYQLSLPYRRTLPPT